jgi:uridine phosphorylase
MAPREPLHLNPACELSDRVLLCGDPQRALQTAQALFEKPRMFNTRRGLWGYTGTAPDGGLVTIQSTGMGGPSTAIVVEELLGLGAQTLIRVGTCGALVDELALSEFLTVSSVIPADGTSQALGMYESLEFNPQLTEVLLDLAKSRSVTAVTTDLFYDDRRLLVGDWLAAGASAVEMEAAVIASLAQKHGAVSGCLLVVTDVANPAGKRRLSYEEIEAAGIKLGSIALTALSRQSKQPLPG